MLRLEDTRAVNMPMLPLVLFELYFKDCGILNVLSFRYSKGLNISRV